MQASSPATLSLSRTAALPVNPGAADLGTAPLPRPEAGMAVDSSTLLQGHKAVAISHNGSVYRLQATKLGKLILTK